MTPSNTCRFAWTDAAVGRDTDDFVTAEIELFRTGDILVVTNGVSDSRPRELPFPYDGYGQDDEWVSANFTNATEIAEAGMFIIEFENLIMPTNVSFYGIEILEVPMVATNAVGYFLQETMREVLDHGKRGAFGWSSVGFRNETPDVVACGYYPKPWLGGGSFTWPIPVVWRCVGDDAVTNVFAQTDQRFELDADGTTRVFKFGYCGERTTNNVFNVERIDNE